MNAVLKYVYPEMRELHVANPLLGDREALNAAWEFASLPPVGE